MPMNIHSLSCEAEHSSFQDASTWNQGAKGQRGICKTLLQEPGFVMVTVTFLVKEMPLVLHFLKLLEKLGGKKLKVVWWW